MKPFVSKKGACLARADAPGYRSDGSNRVGPTEGHGDWPSENGDWPSRRDDCPREPVREEIKKVGPIKVA